MSTRIRGSHHPYCSGHDIECILQSGAKMAQHPEEWGWPFFFLIGEKCTFNGLPHICMLDIGTEHKYRINIHIIQNIYYLPNMWWVVKQMHIEYVPNISPSRVNQTII